VAYAVCRWCSNKIYIYIASSMPCNHSRMSLERDITCYFSIHLISDASGFAGSYSFRSRKYLISTSGAPSPTSQIGQRYLPSHNRTALLFNHLQQHKWSHFLSPELLARHIWLFLFIYSVFVKLCMPVIRSSVNNLDKPWVTPEFRHLIRQHQRALISSQNHFIEGCVIRCNAWRLLSVNMTIQ